ncbi:hypothetical protein DMENIID0001_100960 [Sergentomyia squamirostris]
MENSDLPDDERILLHRNMIDFVIQKRNILDSHHVKAWQIFKKIFRSFQLTPMQLLLEFHCQLLPNLDDYDIDPLYVHYFNKIRYMSAEEKRNFLLQNSKISLKVIISCGWNHDPIRKPLASRSGDMMCASNIFKEIFSNGRQSQTLKTYNVDIMKNAEKYFATIPFYRHRGTVSPFMKILQPTWEFRELLSFYPEVQLTEFIWWHKRIQSTRVIKGKRKKTASNPSKKRK